MFTQRQFPSLVYLAASVALILLALGINWLRIYRENNPVYIQETVNNKVNQALIRADQLIQESALILKKNDTLNIDQLHLNEDDHLYVYRKEELLFWSNTSLVPQRRDLPRSDPFRLYETNTGTYLVYWSSHSGYDIFYLLPLAVRYEVENDYLQASANPIIFPIRTVQLFSTRQGESLPVIHSSGTYLFSFIPNIHEWHDQDKYSDIVLLVFLIGLFLAVSF